MESLRSVVTLCFVHSSLTVSVLFSSCLVVCSQIQMPASLLVSSAPSASQSLSVVVYFTALVNLRGREMVGEWGEGFLFFNPLVHFLNAHSGLCWVKAQRGAENSSQVWVAGKQ